MYLSLGSNLGERARHLAEAIALLAPQVMIDGVSSLYETDPIGVEDQPAFLNLVVAGKTALPAAGLLDRVKEIEREVGRRPTYHWGPRVVDIDVLLYGNLAIQTPNLIVPHPEMHRRAFVLVPLAELAPDAVHTTSGKTIRELRDGLATSGVRSLGPFDMG